MGSTLRELVEIAIGPRLAERGGIGVRSHPLVVCRAATPHVLDVEEFLDPSSSTADLRRHSV
jgi:hypothetical protein